MGSDELGEARGNDLSEARVEAALTRIADALTLLALEAPAAANKQLSGNRSLAARAVYERIITRETRSTK